LSEQTLQTARFTRLAKNLSRRLACRIRQFGFALQLRKLRRVQDGTDDQARNITALKDRLREHDDRSGPEEIEA
jgi:hypothetical protein